MPIYIIAIYYKKSIDFFKIIKDYKKLSDMAILQNLVNKLLFFNNTTILLKNHAPKNYPLFPLS